MTKQKVSLPLSNPIFTRFIGILSSVHDTRVKACSNKSITHLIIYASVCSGNDNCGIVKRISRAPIGCTISPNTAFTYLISHTGTDKVVKTGVVIPCCNSITVVFYWFIFNKAKITSKAKVNCGRRYFSNKYNSLIRSQFIVYSWCYILYIGSKIIRVFRIVSFWRILPRRWFLVWCCWKDISCIGCSDIVAEGSISFAFTGKC